MAESASEGVDDRVGMVTWSYGVDYGVVGQEENAKVLVFFCCGYVL